MRCESSLPAARGSVSVRYWTEASVLNRKCGSTCACIELQLRLDRVLGHEVTFSFRPVQRGGGVRLAELEQEDQARKSP